MTPSKFNHGYTGYRGYGSMTHLCAVREGGFPPSKYPIPAFAKTSYIYVTYVTPVTGLKVLVWGIGWVSEADLLSNEYGFRCLRVVVSNTSEARANGSERPSNILKVGRALFLVIIVSPRHNIQAHYDNYAGIPCVFSCSQFQLCEGDYQ